MFDNAGYCIGLESFVIQPKPMMRKLDKGARVRTGSCVTGAPKMTLDDLRQSLTQAQPPAGLSLALAGLWWDGKGDWKRAHESAQQDEGPEGSWVHAYVQPVVS
jgi:hypothetical protein